jgi:hypothetical protein
LMPARSSMSRRGGRTSSMRSASPGRRCEVRWSTVRGARHKQHVARGETSARRKARGAGGARGTRRGWSARVCHVRPDGQSVESITVCLPTQSLIFWSVRHGRKKKERKTVGRWS